MRIPDFLILSHSIQHKGFFRLCDVPILGYLYANSHDIITELLHTIYTGQAGSAFSAISVASRVIISML